MSRNQTSQSTTTPSKKKLANQDIIDFIGAYHDAAASLEIMSQAPLTGKEGVNPAAGIPIVLGPVMRSTVTPASQRTHQAIVFDQLGTSRMVTVITIQ